MPDDRVFLDEITANPEYRMARLVYADWLEEKGDARAELIRIEEEMWTTPIWADRYWQLKPRRNELRAGCAKKWLDWMNYGNHVEPVFREVPSGWMERWRLLREFVERWHGIPIPDGGGHSDAITTLKQAHGVTFPPSVREWVAFGNDLKDQRSFGNVLHDGFVVEDLTQVSGVSAFSLLLQAEGDVYWAVRRENLREADPAVEMFVRDYDAPAQDGYAFAHRSRVADRLTYFVLCHMAAYLRGAGGGFSISVENSVKIQRQLGEVFPVHATFDQMQIFERQDMIALFGRDHFSEQVQLHVQIAKSLPRKEVPAFLWDYARGGGAFHGMFGRRK